MKKIFYLFAAAMLITACGSNKKADVSSNETATKEETPKTETSEAVEEKVVEVEVEDNLLKPPFTVITKRLAEGVTKILPLDAEIIKESPNSYQLETYEFTVNSNGTWTGTRSQDNCNWRTNYEWINIPEFSNKYEGIWRVDYRTMGEGHEKVYELNDGNYTVYIPESGDYLWIGDWEDCRDMRTKALSAYKILEVKK